MLESAWDEESAANPELDDYFMEEDKMGMHVSAGCITIKKDTTNLIGISIGGGAPLCPCLYVVQVFDNTPAAKDGTLQAGDEIIGVNGKSVKGRTKVEVAKMIQSVKNQVTIAYNKLHADPKQGKTLDIVLKKMKHRIVENMSATTADSLGLSRAILCNDSLVKKLEELTRNEYLYRGLIDHIKSVLKAYYDVCQTNKSFGDAFAAIGVREPHTRASEAFTQFGDAHRQMEKLGIKMLRTVVPVLSDLGTYLNKAVPDTKLTIKKYADSKFEYLSYCLKVKEMDDEEYSYAALQEPLYRVETGNYEYRLILRCRQDARAKFAKLRSDVLVKLELLDQKHVQDVVCQLQRLVTALCQHHKECHSVMEKLCVFPIEVDFSTNAFTYDTELGIEVGSTSELPEEDDDELLDPSKFTKNIDASLMSTDPMQPSTSGQLVDASTKSANLAAFSPFGNPSLKTPPLFHANNAAKSETAPAISPALLPLHAHPPVATGTPICSSFQNLSMSDSNGMSQNFVNPVVPTTTAAPPPFSNFPPPPGRGGSFHRKSDKGESDAIVDLS